MDKDRKLEIDYVKIKNVLFPVAWYAKDVFKLERKLQADAKMTREEEVHETLDRA